MSKIIIIFYFKEMMAICFSSTFFNNCFVDEESLNTLNTDDSFGVDQEGEPKTCLVSLMDEPKVA